MWENQDLSPVCKTRASDDKTPHRALALGISWPNLQLPAASSQVTAGCNGYYYHLEATRIQYQSNPSSWGRSRHHRHLLATRIQHQSNPCPDHTGAPGRLVEDMPGIWKVP